MPNTITMYVGDVRDVMAQLPDNHADLIVTSPPFLALRSYLPADHPDKHREIGSEPTPAAFLDTLYGLSADWGRLLPEWGSLCVELGDTMSGSGGSGGDYNANGLRAGQPTVRTTRLGPKERELRPPADGWPMTKSMCLLPHAYTMGLAYGHNPLTGAPSPAGRWRIRNVITWARPNPPVGSLGKRNPVTRTGDQKFRPACSFITVACRGTGRYFDLDAVRVESSGPHVERPRPRSTEPAMQRDGRWHSFPNERIEGAGAPPLDWHADGDWLWKLATAPYPGSHYATYPLTLPRRLIAAMCPQRVCRECGWPSERIAETTTTKANGQPIEKSNYRGSNATQRTMVDYEHLLNDAPTPSFRSTTTTLGWTDCGHDHWRPGNVLDPFGGSGTTAVAAALQSVDATLIDLDHRNVDLVDKRLRENVRVLERVDHLDNYTELTHVTWTVEVVSATELAADDAGQMGLFG